MVKPLYLFDIFGQVSETKPRIVIPMQCSDKNFRSRHFDSHFDSHFDPAVADRSTGVMRVTPPCLTCYHPVTSKPQSGRSRYSACVDVFERLFQSPHKTFFKTANHTIVHIIYIHVKNFIACYPPFHL